MPDLRVNLNAYIKEMGIRKSYISQKTNLSPSKLSLIFSCKRNLLAEEYILICDALGLPYDFFADEKKSA